MLKQKSLEEIIREHVPLGKQSGTGFYNLRGQCCSDHSERAGFRFDDGFVIYSCFNCQAKFVAEEGSGKLSRKAREILQLYGITSDDLRELASSLLVSYHSEEENTPEKPSVNLSTPEVQLPPRTLKLFSSGHEELQEPLIEYLKARKVDPHLFYFSLDPKHLNRVILPFWRDGKIIYWQSRSINPEVKPRYLNCAVKKDAVIYGYDRLHENETAPLFVCEGIFDALMVDGVCILGSVLTPAKIEVLKRSRRRIIFVRDRDANGDKLSQAALNQGWEITTVDKRVKDINESVTQFGSPFTAYSLISNAVKPNNVLQSKLTLGLWSLQDRRN